MYIYDSINQYTPSIGYLIFGVEDDFLLGGIDSFDNTYVCRIGSASLTFIWHKICDGHSGAFIQMVGQEPQLPIQAFFFVVR